MNRKVRKENLWGLRPQSPRIYRLPARMEERRERGSLAPFHPGPEVGAQVASLRCPILRPGHRKV